LTLFIEKVRKGPWEPFRMPLLTASVKSGDDRRVMEEKGIL
jgi:hypothetical protein